MAGKRKPKAPKRDANVCTNIETTKQQKPPSGHKSRRKRGKRMAPAPDRGAGSSAGGQVTPAYPAIYGAVESKTRLDEHGFDPRVTSLSPAEYVQAWTVMAHRTMAKPSRQEFAANKFSARILTVTKTHHRRATQSTMCMRDEFRNEKVNFHALRLEDRSALYETLLHTMKDTPAGIIIAEELYADGMRTARDFAMTSYDNWVAISHACNIWDFTAGSFKFQGHSGVYMITSPEYNLRHFKFDEQSDPFHEDPSNIVRKWAHYARERELLVFKTIFRAHHSHMKHGRITDREAANAVKNVPDAERVVGLLPLLTDVYIERQLIQGMSADPFQPRWIHSGDRLRQMFKTMFEHKNAIKVLHFEATPLLDRRVLAVLLKSLPHVTMVGIYNCPMIHYGDVLVMLDLIHEVNEGRRARRLPTIDALDFAPHYEIGMPYAHERYETTYGLLWDFEERDTVQRGFYMILMKAFIKAQAMGIRLLFDEGKAFRNFLFRLPGLPLGVPSFLDALYRYSSEGTRNNTNLRIQALYDLLKPVRLGVEDMHNDAAHRYCDKNMQKPHLFCASCGYETFQEFFAAATYSARAWNRVCSGCMLQEMLDKENDHMKVRKREQLSALFPDWKPKTFNKDAPLTAWAPGLIMLRSTTDVRPEPPSMVVGQDGDLRQPAYWESKVRANNVRQVSVQNLPSLEDMVMNTPENTRRWLDFRDRCLGLDILHVTINILVSAVERGKVPRESREYGEIVKLAGGGKWCHIDEKQYPWKETEGGTYKRCHDFVSALDLQKTLQDMNFQAGPPGFAIPARERRPRKIPDPSYRYW